MKNAVMILAAVGVLSLSSCKNTDKQGVITDDVHQATIDSMKQVAEKQRIIDSMQIVSQNTQKQKEVVVVHDQAPVAAAPAPRRKKWSGAAKGAVIGAGVGAVTGAVISKKKGEGAIIGGLAGAGVGAGVGAVLDDKKK
ncbi:YMGG-like glycine zipper-containing protein [Flavobacterium sp.]|uniref:glycine zipper family protein n=1 Tax=Flavobacterium sp. TaxID=239 RepID=UPI0025D0E830|nr:YMGG-like glycine zipper-containing protein [Flavobacterium sp.]